MNIVQDKIRSYRKIEYILKKYSQIRPDSGCLEAISRGDAQYVLTWYKQQLLNELDSLSLRDIRERAATLRIVPIWGISKQQLIWRILELQRNQETEENHESANCKESSV